MGQPPKLETPPVASASDPLNSAPDVQRLLDIKKSYQYWQQHMKSSDKNGKDGKKVPSQKNNSLPSGGASSLTNNQNLFTEKDMLFLKSRLDEIVSRGFRPKSNEVDQLFESCLAMDLPRESLGFDPYGNKDEEGLHEELCLTGDEEDLQDDYDIEEVQDENRHILSRPGAMHHIEIELNDGPPRLGTPDPNEPSCEFTFEYDGNGKLIPTSNNVEEQLRQMNLAALLDLDLSVGGKASKKKKKKKKKRTTSECCEPAALGAIDESLCLFCQYEAFYGQKPVHTKRWLENKIAADIARRRKLKEKLESVKRALIASAVNPPAASEGMGSTSTEHRDHGEDLDCSLNTVVDN